MSDLEEVEFDPDIHPSYVGRLVRVRDNAESDAKWRHAVLCFAMTEWVIEEDPSRRGKRVKLEKPTGGYQLQWGLFERVEQARTQKRGQQSVRPSGEPPSSRVRARSSPPPDPPDLPHLAPIRARSSPARTTRTTSTPCAARACASSRI
jgi:hypothetical protein